MYANTYIGDAVVKVARLTSPIVTVDGKDLEASVMFYEKLLGEPARARLRNPSGTLDLVLIGQMLLIGGDAHALASRERLKGTLIVDSLDDWRDEVTRTGALVLEEPSPGPMTLQGQPIGTFMVVQHLDGHIFEYFQPTR
jgi:hypothetical protein